MGQGCSPKPVLGSITERDEERKGKEEGGKEDRRKRGRREEGGEGDRIKYLPCRPDGSFQSLEPT